MHHRTDEVPDQELTPVKTFLRPSIMINEEDDPATTGYVPRGAMMFRPAAYILFATCLMACGMSDACEELAEARCDCDESMCEDTEVDVEADDKRTQACKEELEAFTCEPE